MYLCMFFIIIMVRVCDGLIHAHFYYFAYEMIIMDAFFIFFILMSFNISNNE